MNSPLLAIGAAAFCAALFVRITDPLVPTLAAEFAVDPHQVTLLATAFALPWALIQPIVGPLGDLLGKTRVMAFCLLVLIASAVIGAVAHDFALLLASRILAGAAAGGVSPVGFALVSDLFAVRDRQVAMGRVLSASIIGILLSGSISGLLADAIGWRGIFVAVGILPLIAIMLLLTLKGVELRPPQRHALSVRAVLANYRSVLANPRTKICYSAVLIEGIILLGLPPFVALLLIEVGESRPLIAGLVISAFAVGGIVYTAAVRPLLAWFSQAALMMIGASIAAMGLLLEAFVPPWEWQAIALGLMGFGFYLLHSCIMVQMTELAPGARGTAVAGHAFSFCIGQAIGPVLYGFGFAAIGAFSSLLLAAVVMVLTGAGVALLLRPRS